jgi:hypothetical protein
VIFCGLSGRAPIYRGALRSVGAWSVGPSGGSIVIVEIVQLLAGVSHGAAHVAVYIVRIIKTSKDRFGGDFFSKICFKVKGRRSVERHERGLERSVSSCCGPRCRRRGGFNIHSFDVWRQCRLVCPLFRRGVFGPRSPGQREHRPSTNNRGEN